MMMGSDLEKAGLIVSAFVGGPLRTGHLRRSFTAAFLFAALLHPALITRPTPLPCHYASH